jgi:predicted small secreted protein
MKTDLASILTEWVGRKPSLKVLALIVADLALVSSLTGCNTVAGFGDDLNLAARALQDRNDTKRPQYVRSQSENAAP